MSENIINNQKEIIGRIWNKKDVHWKCGYSYQGCNQSFVARNKEEAIKQIKHHVK